MKEKHSKREISPILRNILTLDARLTENFVKCLEKFVLLKQLKIHYKALEISCHGIPWITSLLASIWIFHSRTLYQMQVNLLMGLFLDIIIIGVLKAIVRRRRPKATDDIFAVGPDKYSFPSGHASRAMFVFYFFQYLWPVSVIYFPSLSAWVVAVVISRLLMRRHYILDILAGLLVGYALGILMSFLFLELETCISLVSWITDEKIDGAEYDV